MTIDTLKNLSLEDICSAKYCGQAIFNIVWQPDGSAVNYLRGSEDSPNALNLWQYDLKTRKNREVLSSERLIPFNRELSDADKARKERQRNFKSGIAHFSCHPTQPSLYLINFASQCFLYNAVNDTIDPITPEGQSLIDAQFSPNGTEISYIQDQNIHSYCLEQKEHRALTTEGGGLISCGIPEFVVQEELSRYKGYWWSPDEKHILYTKVDESPVGVVKREEIYADRTETVEQRYPLVGTPNACYKVGLLHPVTRETTWLTFPEARGSDTYLARVKWHPNNDVAFLQTLSRDQRTLWLDKVEVHTGKVIPFLTVEQKPWINVPTHNLAFSQDGHRIFWLNEQSGHGNIEEYSLEGVKLKDITTSTDVSVSLVGCTEDSLYYIAATDSGMQRKVARFALSQREAARSHDFLTDREGVESAHLSPSLDNIVIGSQHQKSPLEVLVYNTISSQLSPIYESQLIPRVKNADALSAIGRPEFGSFPSQNSEFHLNYKLYKPRDFVANKSYPAIIYLYGGPHAQVVDKCLHPQKEQWFQYLADQGFIVFSLDNRGSPHRGLTFEAAINRNFAQPEVQDQLEGAQFLQKLSYVNPKRIGVFGHSYGGFMTLHCMFRHPDVFKVGVAGAPVTDFALYDTCYTERYMGTQQEEPEAYERANALKYVEGLTGKLLLVHGMADDNVLFNNTTQLISELVKHEKHFDLMTYPGEKHSISGSKANLHYKTLIVNYFKSHL